MFEALRQAGRIGGDDAYPVQVEHLCFVLGNGHIPVLADKVVHEKPYLVQEILLVIFGLRRDEHGEQYTGDCRMYARMVKEQPQGHTNQHIRQERTHLQLIQKPCEEQENGSREQQFEIDGGPVEDGYHDDGPQVVHDRQRSQEHFQGDRNPVAHRGHDGDGEGDIGGHRDAPSGRILRPVVEQQVDDRRNDHPAERARHRQYRLAERRKVSRNDLSLYLQADGEKEHHHQAVIDETFEVETEPEVADRNAYRCLQQRMVKFGCRRNIGKEHGDHHEKQQHDAARPLGTEKVAPFLIKNIRTALEAVTE